MARLSRKQRQQMGFRILIAALVVVAVYEVFAFADKVYKEYQINLQIEEAKEQKTFLAKNNTEKQNKILYYESDEYKEKVAKSSLNLHRPGEIVINIKDEQGNFLGDNRPSAEIDVEKLPNPKKWLVYFFGIQ
ncbi:MAG: septum formation initiator family protein [Candidatus Gracilibacteria bacterium]|nr:septum formation initiator family protein [Candidatus Gracilibacteria bacterium]